MGKRSLKVWLDVGNVYEGVKKAWRGFAVGVGVGERKIGGAGTKRCSYVDPAFAVPDISNSLS